MASTLRLRSFRGSGRGCLLFGVFLLAGCFVSDEHVGAEPAANVEQAVPGAVGGARAAEASALDSGLLVIGPSFGRTGTASTRAALGILGFGPTHHMAEVIENQAFDAWSRIAVEKNKTVRQALLREELRGYRSAVDAPSAVFYQDLLEMYPAAKVLMTTRDAESWLKSAWDTILLYKKLTWGSPHLFDTWWGFGYMLAFTVPPLSSFDRMLHLVLPMLEDVDTKEGYKKVCVCTNNQCLLYLCLLCL
eukprot:INCI13050.1.p1 GENE.INCI13050.1~~INCI13050.1.p1  ORF type:complete len:248 (-),score=36.12 INCI13050.1:26-769(-)